jgi:hypothetical protein
MDLQTIVANMIATIKQQALLGALQPLSDFLSAVSKDTSPISITLQLGLLNAKLLAAVPGLEMIAAKSLADQLNAEIAIIAGQVKPA